MTFLHTLFDTGRGYFWWCDLGKRSKKVFSGPASGKRHVALLAWSFPPDIAGGVYRPLSLARYGVDAGWNVTVISGPISEKATTAGLALLEELPEQVRVCRTPTNNLPVPSYKLFPRINGGFVHGLNLVETAMREMAECPPSVIVATGPPFHSFMAAWYLSKHFGAKLVLDYRDEWTECPFSFVDMGNVDHWWERRCLDAADAVFFTTQTQLDHNLAHLRAGDPKRFRVVPNGWEPADFTKAKDDNLPRRNGDNLVLSFVGTLGDHTPPGPFLTQMERLLVRREDLRTRVRLQFVGKRSSQSESQLAKFRFPDNLDIRGLVEKKEANRLMSEASGLLLFYGDKFKRYLPGKMYDYLAAGSPLVVVGTDGEVPRILKELGGGYLVPAGDDGAMEKVLDELLAHKGVKTSNPRVEVWLQCHTRQHIAFDFYKYLESL